MRLVLSQLTKSFGPHRVLDSISADFGELRSLALIGPSGGGKSTLLRIIAGLETPDAGSVALDGAPVDFRESALREHRRHIGVVFQAFNLFPHLTALANLTLPLEKVHGFAPGAARDLAQQTLARFQLAGHAHKRPAELSGGQKQRVAIARAIAIKPRLLLFRTKAATSCSSRTRWVSPGRSPIASPSWPPAASSSTRRPRSFSPRRARASAATFSPAF